MKKTIYTNQALIFLLGLFLITSCAHKRTIEISYQMEDVKEFTPSYQLSIWLEKTDGTFVKTLFVSDYLAYGGYLEYGICPSWSKKANWDKTTKEELDAVSGATPDPGDVNLVVECSIDQIPDGEYNLFIQVHLKENLNDTYKGKVNFLSGKEMQVQLKPYKTRKIENEEQKGVVSNIKAMIN